MKNGNNVNIAAEILTWYIKKRNINWGPFEQLLNGHLASKAFDIFFKQLYFTIYFLVIIETLNIQIKKKTSAAINPSTREYFGLFTPVFFFFILELFYSFLRQGSFFITIL